MDKIKDGLFGAKAVFIMPIHYTLQFYVFMGGRSSAQHKSYSFFIHFFGALFCGIKKYISTFRFAVLLIYFKLNFVIFNMPKN